MKVLVIDDEENIRQTLTVALEEMGHDVEVASSGQQALELVGRQSFDAALLDIWLGREQGLDVLVSLLGVAPRLSVVVMTAFAAIDTAVEAMRRGAFDYLPKPFTLAQIRAVLEKVAQLRTLQGRVEDLEDQIRDAVPEADLQAREPAWERILDVGFRAAASDATILLRGESGTGKGVLARAIHARSPRSGHPFVTVSCPSLSAELLESELFGHVRGAFTGAVRDTTGKVAQAEGGTLFLDEIGDLPPPLQPKLLRLLQERQYERVGETRTRTADVRVIAATNKDLMAAVANGQFREDLLYRLNVIEIVLPPLRERVPAIRHLAEHLLNFFARQMGKRMLGFTPEVLESLDRHSWPGNVRELRNAIERAVILARSDRITSADLPNLTATVNDRAEVRLGSPISLEEIEAEHIRRVIANSANLDEAADILGIDRATLYRKRKRYGL